MKKSAIILVLMVFLGASAGLYYGLTRYLEKDKERLQKALEEVEEKENPEEEESDEVVELPSVTYSEADVQEVPPARLMAFDQLLGDAQNEAAIDRWEMSKALLRSAIDLTSNATLRAMAAQEMGAVLLEEAQVTPWPNALAAEQYLEGALELEKDPERREQAEERLRETREILYSSQLVDIPETGNRFQMLDALEKARPVMQTPTRQLEYKLREANATQQTVLNSSWFKEYLLDHPEENPAEAKEKLRTEAMNQYRELTEQASGPVRDEACFRTAELQMDEKKYDLADQTIQNFLDNEPMTFIPETMLLLAQIARAKGDPRRANHLLTQHIERYGISGDSQNQIMEIIREMADMGFYREAADSLEALTRQPQLEPRAHELMAQSQLYRAEYFFKINEPENAEAILSELATGDYPPAIKQAAVSRLFETQLTRNQGNIEMLLTGIQAVESDPENEHAKKILIQMARTVEQMGLPVYAQEIYDKIALLGMAAAQDADASGVVPLSIEAATLGTARCYFKEGNDLKADYLLRKICNNYDVGPLQSEAAFWWAQIAFRHDQLQEASRRLGLMDLASLSPDFTAKAKILDQFINIRLGISNEEVIDPVLAELASLTDADRDFIRTYYPAFFDMWEKRDNLEAMRRWYEGSRASPHREEIPLDDFFLRIANIILEKGTLKDLVAYLDGPDELLPIEQQEQLQDDLWIPFLQSTRQLELTNQGIKLALNELYRKRRGIR
ncbi:MAG: hypothetical protein PHG65_00250 [Kiritimatiellae bacterium]|nr:hypothetical protein [Kiritimatiellia bacterium]